MTKVFLSGSRRLSRLNASVERRLENMIAQGFQIILGDANGIDKAMQNYFAKRKYQSVTIYCSGRLCRNNTGQWDVRHVDVPPGLKGREFYSHKDRRMATEADYGLIVWDGKSAGSLANARELVRNGKSAVIYRSQWRDFVPVKNQADLSRVEADAAASQSADTRQGQFAV
ncbi:MAG: hypothetical protein AcusKO_43040 [Acuticoccus sp.]